MKIIISNAVNISKSTNEYYQNIIEKKWPQNGPFSCYEWTTTVIVIGTELLHPINIKLWRHVDLALTSNLIAQANSVPAKVRLLIVSFE